MAFTYQLQTRYSDTAQDGIVHHSSFIIYLEESCIAFFKSFGFDLNEIEKQNMILPVKELSVKYLKPLRSSEIIEVQVSVDFLSKARFTLHYQITQKKTPVATALITYCLLNETLRPIPIPKQMFQELEKLRQPTSL